AIRVTANVGPLGARIGRSTQGANRFAVSVYSGRGLRITKAIPAASAAAAAIGIHRRSAARRALRIGTGAGEGSWAAGFSAYLSVPRTRSRRAISGSGDPFRSQR